MMECRWLVVCFLASLAIACQLTAAAPQNNDLTDDWSQSDPDVDYTDFVTEDELSDDDLNEIADEIAEKLKNDDPAARNALTTGLKKVGKGIIKGGKKVGSALLTAGKKIVKVTGKGLKVAGKGLKKVGKATASGLKKAGKLVGKGMKKVGQGALKAGKKVKEVMTAKGKKVWASLKEKMNGEFGQAAKQLLKNVGKEVLEQGVSLGVEAVTPMLIEYAMDKTQDEFCKCENATCSCCAHPPGFEKGCLVLKVRPGKKMMSAGVVYKGRGLASVNITKHQGAATCTRLSGLARFIQTCVSPQGIGEIDGGIRGCMIINVEPLSLERSICVDFKGNRKNGSGTFVPFAELDAVELENNDDEVDDDDDDDETE